MVWYGGVRLKCERDMRGGGAGMCAGGQTERHCGKVGGRSDESAPEDDTPGVWAAGQGHGRCYHMRTLDQISALVAVGGAGSMVLCCGWGLWVRWSLLTQMEASSAHVLHINWL